MSLQNRSGQVTTKQIGATPCAHVAARVPPTRVSGGLEPLYTQEEARREQPQRGGRVTEFAQDVPETEFGERK